MSKEVKGKNIYATLLLLVITLFSATLLLAHPASEVSLKVVSPNGEELWRGDQVIMWNSSGIEQVDIWFSGDNGNTWTRIAHNISSLDALVHQWEWDTSQYNDTFFAVINISTRFGYGGNGTQGEGYGNIDNTSLYDLSDAPFTLDNTPPVTANISAIPLIQEAGDNISLSASIKDNVGVASVILSLQFPDSHWENIPLQIQENSGLYWYNRSYVTLGIYNYSYFVTDQAGNQYTSPWHSFAIEDTIPPVVTLLSPLGDETLSGEVVIQYNITDNSDASFNENITIEYSPDGGTTWLLVGDNLYNIGYYRWNTTSLPDGQFYLLRINVTDQRYNWGIAQSPIPLTLDNSPPHILLQTPRGGTILPDLLTITWQAWDAISPDTNITIDISYSLDNGGTWTSIIQNISNTGLYAYSTQHWNDSNTCLLQITATDEMGNQGYVISDTPLIKDAHPPRVTIARPHEGWLHIRDQQICPLPLLKATLVIGRFTVQIDSYDYLNITGIGHIDISVDHIIRETLWEKPYQWEWYGTLGKHLLTATAYDYAGNHATASQDIFILTFPSQQDTPGSGIFSS